MSRSVPDLQLDLSSFIVFGSIVGIEHSGFVESWELLLGPGHDDGRLAHGRLSDEDKFDVVFFILVNVRFTYLYHLFYAL